MDRFVLEFMNENNQVVNTFTDRGQNNNRDVVEVNYPGPTPSLTLRVALTTQRNQAQQHIELCEVEAFGDCVAPYYGLECQKLCSRACLNQVCHTTGQCIKCADGGTTCNENVTPKNILVPPTQVPRRERKHEAESQALVIVFFLLTLSVSIFCFFIYLVMRNRKALICSKGTNVEASESHMQPIIPVTAVSQRPASDISSIYSEAKTESSV
ncbi:uncharacterized protein LOC131943515 [Physella acuta]|uniref:uncharacterized protein LOC131943515 n=1 Tax=Physella acuta TaxID=109671 RepID=UPI0027DAFC37|nr:uncharacterized protein LOC131943515 [Physella acuta]